MSNLTRKVKKATEPFKEKVKRSQRKYQKRLKHLQKTRFPWHSATKAKVLASMNLPEEVQKAITNKHGAVDLDLLKFTTHIKWTPSTGWYPEVVAEVVNDG